MANTSTTERITRLLANYGVPHSDSLVGELAGLVEEVKQQCITIVNDHDHQYTDTWVAGVIIREIQEA